MSEYRRWISYIYTYENGEKRKNAGYVRSELRNGQVRITVYMDTKPKPEQEELCVCVYRLQGERCEGAELGRLQQNTGKEEFRVEQAAENVAGNGWSFVQVAQNGGFLIFPAKAAEQENYLIAAMGAEIPTEEQTGQMIRQVRENGRRTVPERKEERKSEKVQPEPEKVRTEKEETQPEQGEKAGAIEEHMTEDAERNTAKSQSREMDTEEMDGRVIWNVEVQPAEELPGERGTEYAQPVHEPTMVRNACCGSDRSNRPFCCLEAMYPFEDGEFERSVRMEPQDIGLLPRSMWKYAGNSFLLHGFYTYHHLLLARKRTKEGERCYLLVPGIYGGREMHMAQMFGFRQFKCLKRKKLENGDFGYWYLEVPQGEGAYEKL